MHDQFSAPYYWEHVRGTRLDRDGQSIEYRNEMAGLTALVETIVNDDTDATVRIKYRPTIIDTDGDVVEHLPSVTDKQNALVQLSIWMGKYRL